MRATNRLISLALLGGATFVASSSFARNLQEISAPGRATTLKSEALLDEKSDDEKQSAARTSETNVVTYQALRARAARGDVEALLNLGKMYFDGTKIEKNDQESYRFFDAAAKKGSDAGRWASQFLRFQGIQKIFENNGNYRNYDLEKCPSDGEYIKRFSNYTDTYDRELEWPYHF